MNRSIDSELLLNDQDIARLFTGFERRPLALAVSGGVDSMALMHMIARWSRRSDVRAAWAECWRRAFRCETADGMPWRMDWAGLGKPSWLRDVETVGELEHAGGIPHVVVLTVDHGLRGATSADEARFVAEQACALGLPCVILKWDGDKPATGIQEAARTARRDLMCDVLRAERGALADIAQSVPHGAASDLSRVLVMAHHREDQAETFLMRLVRGSGLEGLSGIRPRDLVMRAATAERPHAFEAPVWRPLLDVPKARLAATLESYGARWVDDPSNDNEQFERVRVRKMLAQLGEVGLTAEKIALSARRLRDAEFDFRHVMQDSNKLAERRAVFSHGALMSEFEISGPFFSGPYVAMRSLRQILRGHGGSARDVELAQVEKLLSMRAPEDGWLSGMTLAGCKIEFLDESGRRLRIYREGSGAGLPAVSIRSGQIVDWDGRRFEVSASEHTPPSAVVRALGMQGWADLKRAVPRIADLKWPAAAAATLPVIACGDDLIAYPGIDSVLTGLGNSIRAEILADWAAFQGEHGPMFCASFTGAGW